MQSKLINNKIVVQDPKAKADINLGHISNHNSKMKKINKSLEYK